MPVQTAIKIRRSSVASKIPLTTDLVLGELALNTTDGVLYFKKSPSGVDSIVAVATLDGTQTLTNKTLTSPVVSGGTIDNAVIGGTTPAAITGSSVTSTGNLLSTYSAGDEGGEIFLAKPQTNTSIVTGVRIDIYQNKLRFWEDGGTNRGAYIDLTSATAGVGSNLLTGGGGGGGTTTNALTIGTGLSGTSFNGSTAVTIAIDSTVVTLTGTQTLTNKTLTLPVIDNIRTGYTTTATAAGTTTLTVASNHYQRFTGFTTQTIVLPVTSTLAAGIAYEIENASTGNLTVNSSGGNLVITITPGVTVQCMCIGTTLTTAADWDAEYNEFATITGTGSNVLGTSPSITSPSISSITVTGTMSLTGSSSSTSSFHTNQTSGTLTLGGTSGTGTITLGQSTVSQTTNIQAGATASGSTKTVNIGTGGLTGSTTTIAIGSTFGTTVTANGTWTYSGANAYGTPASITLTNATGLPVSGITASTSTALGVGSIELGHATDTTIARSSAGVVTIEGVEVVTLSRSQTLTNKTISLGSNTITGTLAQLNTAITDADVAAATHKYHEFTLNTYYYDSYSQERYFRLFTQNATYDTARYSPVTNVEYWNGTAWVTWTGGDAIVKNLLDGRDDTYADIDHTHKKFRFTINKNSGWPTNAIIATYMSWYGNAWTPYTLTIEDTADQVTWTTKETLTFGNTTNTNADYGWHAFYSGNLHNGRTLNRITYDITDWTDSGAYVTKPIYAFSIFSNYSGASDSIGVPVSWNYDKVVNFSAIPTVSSVQVATISASQTLTNKTISGSSNTLSNISNSSLTNSSVTIGSTAVSLGGTATTIAGLTSVTSTTFVGALTGNATTATTLATARAIYGNNFDGSAALTQVIAGTYGGTGVNNGSNTITVAGNVSHAGAFTQTFTATGNTSVTLPTSGTLATTGNLSQFAATTSAQLAGVISDETGSGSLVFGTSPTFTTSIDAGATFTAFASPTTVTEYAAATSLTIGGTASAQTISIGASSTSASTYNFGTGATTTGLTKTVNLGTAGAAGSTTNVNIGSTSGGTTTVNNNLVVTGTFTVNGTTETINATTVTVDDKNIELGSVASPTDTTANGGGITLKGATDKTIIWDSANANWTSSENWNLATSKTFKINNVSVLSSTQVLGKTIGGTSAGDIVSIDGTQTLTNKTLSSAVITGTVTAGGAVGTAGQVLSSTGTGVQWVAPSAGGGLSVDESIIYSMIF